MKHFLAFTFVLLLGTGMASASALLIDGSGTYGSFTGSLDYNSGTHKLTVTLTNTSPVSSGNYLTGFVFNVLGTATATETATTHGFVNLTGNGLKAQPFGTFEAGAAIGGSWEGGGTPSGGLNFNPQETQAFVFNVTGSSAALAGLDNDSFFTTHKNSGTTAAEFLVRFRGGCVSAKIAGERTPPGPSVPLPAAAWSGIGMLGALALGAKRRSIKALIGL